MELTTERVYWMRVRKIKNLEQKIKAYDHLLLKNPGTIGQHFDQKSLELEIGFGKGDFLLEMAKRHPERNFLGIERSSAFALKAMREVGDLDNIRFMTGNVQNLLPLMEDNLFSGLYLNFSDPWPKPRHYKRRLTYRQLLLDYDRILKPGSLVQIKTDSKTLFAFTLEELFALKKHAFDVTLDLHGDARWKENIPTIYEEKFSAQGKSILGLRYRSE